MGNRALLDTVPETTQIVRPASQSERVLRWVKWAMAAGIAVLAIFALTASESVDGWRVFTIGILAALAAAASGGALGLLFGLPISSRVTVVNQPTGSESAPTGPARQDWFSDNTSIEQIADWLTKIIVGLTLVQWEGVQFQFNRAAAAVTAAMFAPAADAASPVPATISGDGAIVPGGVILGAYAVLGFLLIYLWSRRYLPAELAAGRGDLMKNQKEAEDAFLARAAGAGAVQASPGAGATAAMAGETAALPFDQKVGPGTVHDDPWKDRFGGRSTDGRVEVTAAVEALQTRNGWYAVAISVRGVTTRERLSLVASRARIYLHDSFPEHIHELRFGPSGEIKLELVCYEGFTVGVQLEDGRLFELDLAQLPNVPDAFRGS